MRRKWSDEALTYVAQASAEGKTSAQIAAVLGRTPGVISSVKYQYGIKRATNQACKSSGTRT